ncbi:hypothetical protein ES708_29590 [subsurface metagenome]
MPPGDIYTSMDKGVLDGWMISWEAMGSFRLQEVTDYFTTANTYVPALSLLMNLDSWNKLPPDIQKVFEKYSYGAGAEFFGSEFDRFAEEGIAEVMAMPGKEIIELTPAEVERWEQAVKLVWDTWLTDMEAKQLPGEAVLDEALKLLE